VIAFALQPIGGLVADRFLKPRYCALLGIACTAAAFFSLLHHPWITVVCAGVGNALYHVGGGIAALTVKNGHAAPSGYFVAPGAIGLAVGALIGSRGVPELWFFTVLLAVSAVLIKVMTFPEENSREHIFKGSRVNSSSVIAVLLLVSVALRSYIGFTAGSVWQGNRTMLLIIAAAAACGKGCGGIMADRFGWQKTGTGALLISTLFLVAWPFNIWASVSGMLFLQMSMPITLAALYRVLPGKPGQAFGLCCLALIIGAIPAITPYKLKIATDAAVFSGMLISITTFYISLQMLRQFIDTICITYDNKTCSEIAG
jgi:FSR family fosmidomycin resistance protein-like MFS transporter